MNNLIQKYYKILKNNNFKDPYIEIRALLNNSNTSDKEIILSNLDLKKINLKLLKKSFERRLLHEPVSKIFNKKNFWKHTFYVDKNVLDPRPESEIIIETVLKYFKDNKRKIYIADLGTGSGSLAISLAKEFTNSKIIATDISKRALKIAKKNSFIHSTSNQIKFVKCNWIKSFKKFNIIVSNPPYLTDAEYKNTTTEIKKYEPKKALLGGSDGLDCYRILAKKIYKILHPNTFIFLEIGYKQSKKCIKIFAEYRINCLEIVKDYQQKDRVLVFKKI
tara:strand:- start:1328 stop:2158 length:831 start_codon:yes stop_codon:yes gene_type:complete